MEEIKSLLRKTERKESIQSRINEAIKLYGDGFKTAFDTAMVQSTWKYYDVHPGEPVDILDLKMLCKEATQGALDSHHAKGGENDAEDGSENIVEYVFDVQSLSSTERYYLKKDSKIFSTLTDILDCRKCKQFVILTRLDTRRKVICYLHHWVDIVKSEYIGGFKNLYSATCIREFGVVCGHFAACVNYSNLLSTYESNCKTNLNLVFTNVCLLNKGDELLHSVTRYGTKFRREFLTRTSFEMCKIVLTKAHAGQAVDNMNENYARIMMQLPCLTGSNFNHFSVIDDEINLMN